MDIKCGTLIAVSKFIQNFSSQIIKYKEFTLISGNTGGLTLA